MKVYLFALLAVILLDGLCLSYVVPSLQKYFRNDINVGVGFSQAIIISSVSAFVIGIVLLEGLGSLTINGLVYMGFSKGLAITLVKNTYATAAPIINAAALIIWTRFIPKLGFYEFWPDALVVGIILHYIDYGMVVPWSFRIADAIQKSA